ncbi:hypothetical protein INS49_008991 [Diaporthe citri]|uniref:uncharacterized protein n=1 Tax=Diaporthe citri TaxID=83186 RepID=UPI001C816AE1|nr:uncharacterized protein INS49_008991 [Diaporthe citri]KAG6363888.1 hypothetical protein INS49_008991 [Diaporthe citri]
MEVAGLVLGVVGALPVIVQIVKGYQIIIETTQVRRYMAMLEQDLSTEGIILRHTYERLLNGIVPAWELDDLQDLEPSSSKWKKYDDQIRIRLRESYQDFHLRAKAIAEAVQDLRERLPTGTSSQVSVTNWSSKISGFASEAKVRTRLTFKKKDCTGTVSKIRQNNILLRRLIDHSAAFEPTRRANSQAKFAKKVRTTARGLFSSLCNVMRCQCVDSHMIGLHLRQRAEGDVFSEDAAAPFEMIFGTNNGDHGQDPSFELLNIQWTGQKTVSPEQTSSMETSHCFESLSNDREVSVQKARFSLGASLGEAFPKLRRSPSPSKPECRRKVRFSETVTPTPKFECSVTTIGTRSIVKGVSLSHITDLCSNIKRGEAIANQPIGFIPCAEIPEGFNIYRHDCLRNFNKASLTLRDALSSNKPGSEDFELAERLNVALALSFGILQLCNTHWLEKVVSLEGIVCLRAVSLEQQHLALDLEHPSLFLVRQPSSDLSPEKPGKPINFALLSLGVVLTHIIMGRRVEAIDISEDMTKETLLSKRNIAYNQVEICDYASTNYVDAVQWCLQNCFTFKTLEDENLSRDFHDAVIARLESDLGSIQALNVEV